MSALNWAARHYLPILGIGADGDSKFRKYFVEEFLKRPTMVDEVVLVSHKGSVLSLWSRMFTAYS